MSHTTSHQPNHTTAHDALHSGAGRRWGANLLAAASLALVASLAACGGGGNGSPMMHVDTAGNTTLNGAGVQATLSTYALQPLSPAEVASLSYMREEEQLAHDVYAVSATRWGLPIFSNIASSETTHSASMKLLLDRYQLPDPLAGLSDGHFKTVAMQTLYGQLTAASAVSLVEALKVGAEIEELDIHDLESQKATIDNADILFVYEMLLRGSRNHLRAYWSQLTSQGGTYTPKYITQAQFDAIVNSPMETGR